MSVSACIIVKDEESCIERCIKSLHGLADEIVVVDTGSKDMTKSIAKEYTDKIYDFIWNDDFSAARNFALSKAASDWIFIIDADEVIDEINKKKILEVLNSDADAVLIIQREYQKDKNMFGLSKAEIKNEFTKDYVWYTATPIIRLFRNNDKIFYEGRVHETVGGSVERSGMRMIDRRDIFIHHYKDERGEDKVKEKEMKYLKILEDSIMKNPDDARVHYKIAAVYETYMKNYEKALAHAKIALERGYNRRYCLILIGGCQFQLGMHDDAEKTLVNALESGYDEPAIYFLLYKIYYLRKDMQRARIVLKKLASFDTPYKQGAIKALQGLHKLYGEGN